MQGWLFLTFVMIGSLIGVTGMRQIFIEPLPDPSANVVWLVLQIMPLLLCHCTLLLCKEQKLKKHLIN